MEPLLRCCNLPYAEIEDKSNLLGGLCFTLANHPPSPIPQIPARPLHGTELHFYWQGGKVVEEGTCTHQHTHMRYRADGHILWGSIEVDAQGNLQTASHHAYVNIFQCLAKTGYGHLWRMWNYLPRINDHSLGLERYRHFNIGRHSAIDEMGQIHQRQIPAACTLGVNNGLLSISFLAGKTRPMAIENSRQVSAYSYPPEYGPKAPYFSRATHIRLPSEDVLFISGTASIVGHESRHLGDALAQTEEILTNLQTIVDQANRDNSSEKFRREDLHLIIYIRNSEDYPLIRQHLQMRWGQEMTTHFLQADICRKELLVEIEAHCCVQRQP